MDGPLVMVVFSGWQCWRKVEAGPEVLWDPTGVG
jgi:hypothetical protein